MFARTLILASLLLVSLAPVGAADPPPSYPGADCQVYELPAGGFVERCDGEYVIAPPSL